MNVRILELAEAASSKTALVGSKAAYLGELLLAGFNVPNGFVVVAGSGIEEADDIVDRWLKLTSGSVAVRSSAGSEDLDDASFAGQYESILNVQTAEELLAAIAKCRSSGHADRVRTYAATRQSGPVADQIAVLVQIQVAADIAGIAFSANPITGDRSEVVINAVRGLGDRAASGEITPQQVVVHNDIDASVTTKGDGLDVDQARGVAELTRSVAAHFDRPQDIEWAIADGQVYLLQARPITSLPEPIEPVPVPIHVPEGFWQRDAGHAPQPNSPLYSSMVMPHANVAGKAWFEEYGFLLEGMEWKEIGGWQYICLRPLGGKAKKPPPPVLMPILWRVIPQLRRRVRSCVEGIRSDRADSNLQCWHSDWKPGLRSTAEGLRAVDLHELSDDELIGHFAKVSDFIADALRIHFVLHGAGFLHIAELASVCRELLNWNDAESIELLSGLSGTSTEPAAKLSELAQEVLDDPVLRSAITAPRLPTLDDLSDLVSAFANRLVSYLDEYGYRALRYEVIDPTLAENPDLVIQILRDQVVTGFDQKKNLTAVRDRAKGRLAEAQRILADRPAALTRFETALHRARLAYPVREDSELFTVSLPLGLARVAALELGSRLVARDQIADRDDVFYLEYSRALELLAGGGSGHEVVLTHKGERAWSLTHPGPATYGDDPGPPPSLDGFPAEVRVAMGSLLWAVERTFETDLSSRIQKHTGRIDGIAASPGRYTGTARLVMDETQFDRIQAGDVLVCPITSPVWSILFPSVGALVTDTGGILSHPAIIAREYRIPAVVATGSATSIITDGARVTVDGSSGVIELG